MDSPSVVWQWLAALLDIFNNEWASFPWSMRIGMLLVLPLTLVVAIAVDIWQVVAWPFEKLRKRRG